MKQGTAMQIEEKSAPQRVSVPLTNEMLEEIDVKAERAGVSRSAFLTRLVKYGLEAEQQKRDNFMKKMRQYRECGDKTEAEQLGNEIGEMIFGQ
jgi:metal-responsive CopG/Arc/MetJ family transcriptional regulator